MSTGIIDKTQAQTVRMDLRASAAAKQIVSAVPVVKITDPVPLVLRAVERCVGPSERAEVLDMLGVA